MENQQLDDISKNSPQDSNSCYDQYKKKPKFKWTLINEGMPCVDENNYQTISATPQIKNHTATLYKNKLYVFGGYDGKKNHSQLRTFDIKQNGWIKTKKPSGNAPQGRNGHTATLVDEKVYIIGGWLGQGPLAANDMHILDLEKNKWLEFTYKGSHPGPCNMHTADAYGTDIYVFRGGDGRDYLNDLHRLDTLTLTWTKLDTHGN